MTKNTDVEEIKETLLELKELLGDVGDDFTTKIKAKARHVGRKVEEKIENNPFGSVGIALGAGAIIGAVLYALLRR